MSHLRDSFTIALLLLLLPATVMAGADKLLELEIILLSGGTLHLDPALADDRRDVIAAVEAFGKRMKASATAGAIDTKLALSELNALLGLQPDEAMRQMQWHVLKRVLAMARWRLSDDGLTVYVINVDAAKAHLRAGGTLPGTTYDPATDTATFAHHASSSTASGSGEAPDLPPLVIPVAPNASAAATVRDMLGALVQQTPTVGVALHEVAELSILEWLQPSGVHWRWFSDGFADTVAKLTLQRLELHADADNLRRGSDLDASEDLRTEANLRYWLTLSVAIDGVTKREERLNLARYAFAWSEVQRLVDDHGDTVLASILRAAAELDRPGSDDLAGVIERVTGEPFGDRLDAYQPFATIDEGMAHYAAALDAARKRNDPEAALTAVLRLMELRFADGGYHGRFYVIAADLLREMGRPEVGAQVLRQQVEKRAKDHPAMAATLRQGLVVYAIAASDPSLAWDVADDAVAHRPEFAPARVIQLHRRAAEGDTSTAEAARRLLDRIPADADSKLRGTLEALAAPSAAME